MRQTHTDEAFSVQRSANGQELYVTIDPSKLQQRLSVDQLMEAVISAGGNDYQIQQEALFELADQDLSSQAGPVVRTIARRAQAEIGVEVSTDEMQAWLTVASAPSSPGLQAAALEKALQQAGVVWGIQPEILQRALSQGFLEKTLIAEGSPPEPGKAAWFEYLVPEKKVHRPALRADGTVDFRELNIVTSVPAGTPLMRKHPASIGRPGATVTGHEIPVEPGQDLPLQAGFGTACFPEDPNLLVAVKGGRPVRGPCAVRIDAVFTVDSVGVGTGNISFHGSVMVNGPVESGFSVQADGDIEVIGVVEAATLDAGGNIYIRGGVVGNGKARLCAKGSISANFIEKAWVESHQNLYVQESLLHSVVRVAGSIVLGVNNGKGQISGGELAASNQVKAKILGSPAATNTTISVGILPQFKEKMRQMEQEMQALKTGLAETIKAIVYLRTSTHPDTIRLAALEAQRDNQLYRIDLLKEAIYKLRMLIEQANSPGRVIGLDRIYAGVNLSFWDIHKQITEDLGGSAFSLRSNQEIVLGPLTRSDMKLEEDWAICA